MRKTLLIILLVCAISLAGCSEQKWRPERASSDIQPYAERAIEIIDAYLSFKMTADEATEEFNKLVDRVESMDFTGLDSEYSSVDQNLAYEIKHLDYPSADKRTDLEYRQIRDVIAYQIGKDVSGRVYPAEYANGTFADEPGPNALKDYNAPASSAYAHEGTTDSSYTISISFDYMNGLGPLDMIDHVERLANVLSSASRKDNITFTLYASYECYEQDVFSLHLEVSKNSASGFVASLTSQSDITFSDVNSVKEIAPALEEAAKYFDKP